MTSFARTRTLTFLVASNLALGGCVTAEEPEVVVEDIAVVEESAEDIAVVAGEDDYVILYSGRKESLVQPLIDVFMEQSGVQVDIRYAGTSELAAQILEEGSQSPAAVFLSQDAGALGALGEAGLLDTLPERISNRVDPAFTSSDGSWVGVTGRARVIVYDSENVAPEDLPTDADDIVGPQWSGKVGVAPANASFQSFVTAYRVIRGETAADQWVSGLVINDPQIKAMEALWTYNHPLAGEVRSPRPPAQFSETPSNIHAHTPTLGEHNVDVLKELGFGDVEIEAFSAAGVVYAE